METLYRSFQPTLSDSGLNLLGIALTSILPSRILRGAVHSYLQIEVSEPTPYPIIPDGGQSIFISPHGAIIGGAQSRATDFQILQPGVYFGIRFHPASLKNFFRLDLSEITDAFVDPSYVPCPKLSNIHHYIFNKKHFHERAQVCDALLLPLFTPHVDLKFNHALSLIYRSFGSAKVSQLARLVGWNSRHLNRKFREYTGLNTKTFSQVIRIQRACRVLAIDPTRSLKVAHDLGFTDQSHLLKDYKRLLYSSGSTIFR